ncbi:hypothetical protein GGI16_006002, partial [Coemansia sp. S142-1]
MQEARSRRAFGTSTAASQQPSNDSGASGKKTGPSDTPQPAGATKRSLTFAIGGILALLGVTSYTLLRQPSGVPVEVATQAKPTPSSTQTALES